ncbi:MAG TPA: ATP-binding protein [Verrucomicrobiae bacterium]|jgi:signal transduction histidine kinase|nr:ATP-binding protein [Verrucomicrobiae bacterium]
MGRLRLQSQLLLSTLLIICALTGAILLIIRQTVRTQIAGQVKYSTDASIQEFGRVTQQLQQQLSRTAALLAEIPTLKALMTTHDVPTIQDGSVPFWKLAGSDLLLLAEPDGRVVAMDVTQKGFQREAAENNLRNSLQNEQDSALWYSGGHLYWVFLHPIQAGMGGDAKILGLAVVGYEINSKIAEQLGFVAESQIVLLGEHRIIASTFPPMQADFIQRRIDFGEVLPGDTPAEVDLGEDTFEVVRVTLQGYPPSPVECYAFISLTRPIAFIRQLNRTILVVGLTAILLASFLLHFVSGTITHPLENLVAGVRALAAGDYTYSITPRGSSEVAELAEAFSKMRGDLLAFQKKQIETERVAALGRAANSLSHDLRHQLAALVANAEFLYEAEKLKLNRDEAYREIQTASEQMTELLDSLRDLARERRNISPVSASIDQCVRHAIEAARARPERREVEISMRTSGDMAGVFDPRKVERALLNLALNACDAVAGHRGKIVFEVLSTQDNFEIRVSDNGPGIPVAIRNNLFDPFVSAGKPNGTGLGLAIVSKIISDHGGTASVEGTSDRGTTFLIKMPRVQLSADEVPEKVTT